MECLHLTLAEGRVSSKQSNYFVGSNRNEPLFRLFFGLFRETKHLFFSVCFGLFLCGVKQPKQTEIISKKQISIRVSSKELIFFSVRTETNRNSTCFVCFSVCFFCETKKNVFFGLFRCFGPVSKQPKQTELM